MRQHDLLRSRSYGFCRAKKGVRGMDAKKYVEEEERLTQATHGKLPEIMEKLKEVFRMYNLDLSLGIAADVTIHTLESLQLERINVTSRFAP